MSSSNIENIHFIPPKNVARTAEEGLQLRAINLIENNKACGTLVGLARARQLSKRKPVSLKTIVRMKAFFDRHHKNRNSFIPKCGYVAWLLWGGDPGRRWAEKIYDEYYSE